MTITVLEGGDFIGVLRASVPAFVSHLASSGIGPRFNMATFDTHCHKHGRNS